MILSIPALVIWTIIHLKRTIRLCNKKLVLADQLPIFLLIRTRLARNNQMLPVLLVGLTDVCETGNFEAVWVIV